MFKKLCTKLKKKNDSNIDKIVRIKIDHDKEFENTIFANFCDTHGMAYDLFIFLLQRHQNKMEC